MNPDTPDESGRTDTATWTADDQEPVTQEPAPQEPGPAPQEPDSPNREAAKWRRQLRQVEAERDALRAREDERDRQEVERLAGERMASPADLWLSTGLDAMRDEDGVLDAKLIEQEVRRVLNDRPHWSRREPPPDLHAGARRDVPPDEPPSPFGDAFRRARRGGV